MALQIMVYKELKKQEWLNWITYGFTLLASFGPTAYGLQSPAADQGHPSRAIMRITVALVSVMATAAAPHAPPAGALATTWLGAASLTRRQDSRRLRCP
jgi:hypothetical protein